MTVLYATSCLADVWPKTYGQKVSLCWLNVRWWRLAQVRILVVEDEEVLADAIARGLRREGHAVDVSLDGADALEQATLTTYDVVVLDRDLPVVHGDDVCRRLVQDAPSCRVLMLTAAGALGDRVDGLRLGADDYLAKPFAFVELVARIEALGRRAMPRAASTVRIGSLSIDRATRRVERGGAVLDLTAKEFGVLDALASDAGAVLSAEDLLERVWDRNTDPFTNAVRVTMVGLRHKLGDPPLIETLRGVGYRLVDPTDP